VIIIGLIVSSNEPSLLIDGNFSTKASPFVIAIQNAKIEVLPGVFNGVILVTTLSVANTSVYASTRTLVSLAEHKKAPAVLSYIDINGRPLVAFAVAFTFGMLVYIVQASDPATIFNWLLGLSGLSTTITWGSICIAHILYRKALGIQGHRLENLVFKTPFGVWGSWLGLFMNCGIFVAHAIQALMSYSTDLSNEEAIISNNNTIPYIIQNDTTLNRTQSTSMDDSIPLFLAVLVFTLSFLIYKVYCGFDEEFFENMDLQSGRWIGYHLHPSSMDLEGGEGAEGLHDNDDEEAATANRKWWLRVIEFLCY
jgi:amino acid permease